MKPRGNHLHQQEALVFCRVRVGHHFDHFPRQVTVLLPPSVVAQVTPTADDVAPTPRGAAVEVGRRLAVGYLPPGTGGVSRGTVQLAKGLEVRLAI